MLENTAVRQLIKLYGFMEIEAAKLVKSYIESGKYLALCEFLTIKADTSHKEVSE